MTAFYPHRYRGTIAESETPGGRSLLTEDEVDDPAAADVRPRAAAVGQDGFVVAARVDERVGEDGQIAKPAVLGNALRDARNRPLVPCEYIGRDSGRGAERVPEDTPQDDGLRYLFLFLWGVREL